jgi:hypothetical protein
MSLASGTRKRPPQSGFVQTVCLVIIQSALRKVHAQEMTATYRRGMARSQELALELPLAQSPKPTEFCR